MPAKLQDGTIDPLTAFLRLRTWLPKRGRERRRTKKIRLPIFDGRKRFDLEATYLSRKRYEAAQCWSSRSSSSPATASTAATPS